MREVHLLCAALAVSLLSAACRRVQVEDETPMNKPPVPGQSDAGASLINDIDQVTPGTDAGGPVMPPPGEDAGAPRPGEDASPPPPRPDGGTAADTGGPATPSLITGIEVLLSPLTALNPPAVGSEGVSLLHYPGGGQATAYFVDWNGASRQWYMGRGAYYLYVAASGARHLALLYGRNYEVHAGGEPAELSGSPTSYKEFLAANEVGFAWVDYELPMSMQGGGRPMPGMPLPGKVMFSTFNGARGTLTDTTGYRARLDLSRTHVTFVEYAGPGTIGQIVVQPLAGGAPIIAAASTRHQDRPAIDGDWVVWEEYLGGADAVIRARNLVTGQVRDLSATTGFRTNADLQGTRVVWEDQRNGNGDIYTVDLAAGGERVAVSGKGHSAAPRLAPGGLVWIEANAGTMGLVRAKWTP